MLEDPWNAPPEEPYALTSRPLRLRRDPMDVVVGFELGIPISLDGEELPLAELIAQTNRLAGAYGIGRIDMIENRAVGIKSREVYEAPGAIALIAAHSALEDVAPDEGRGAPQAAARAALDGARVRGALVQPRARGDRRVRRLDAAARSTGDVRLELRPNAAVVTGRRSPHVLYSTELSKDPTRNQWQRSTHR